MTKSIMLLSLILLASKCSALRHVNSHAINAFQEPAPELLKSRKIVINLDRRSDRIQRFSNFLSANSDALSPSRKVGFTNNWCRHSAFDGRDKNALANLVNTGHIRQEDFNYIYRKNQTKRRFFEITPGSMGSYKSHMDALGIIAADTTVDFGVIAEDDLALLSPDFDKHWDLLHQPKTWNNTDMIYLQSCTKEWPQSIGQEVDYKRMNNITTKLVDRQGRQTYCVALYAVTADAARRLTQEGTEMYPMTLTFDGKIPRTVKWLKAKAFYPPIAQALSKFEPSIASDIDMYSLLENKKKKSEPMDYDPNSSAIPVMTYHEIDQGIQQPQQIPACEAPPAIQFVGRHLKPEENPKSF